MYLVIIGVYQQTHEDNKDCANQIRAFVLDHGEMSTKNLYEKLTLSRVGSQETVGRRNVETSLGLGLGSVRRRNRGKNLVQK